MIDADGLSRDRLVKGTRDGLYEFRGKSIFLISNRNISSGRVTINGSFRCGMDPDLRERSSWFVQPRAQTRGEVRSAMRDTTARTKRRLISP